MSALFLICFQITVLLLNVKNRVYFRILRPFFFNYAPKSVPTQRYYRAALSCIWYNFRLPENAYFDFNNKNKKEMKS